jgi:hypothetical protein
MSAISSRELCKGENLAEFFEKVLRGEKIVRTEQDQEGKPVKRVVANKGHIYLGDKFYVSLWKNREGKVQMNYEILTIEDMKKIKEHRENNGGENGGGDDL